MSCNQAAVTNTKRKASHAKPLAILILVSTLAVTPSPLTEQSTMKPMREAKQSRTGVAIPCQSHFVRLSTCDVYRLSTSRSTTSHPAEKSVLRMKEIQQMRFQ